MRPRWTKLGLEAGGKVLDDVGRTRTFDRTGNRWRIIPARQVTNTDAVLHPEFESAKVLKSTRDARSPLVRRHPSQLGAIDQNSAGCRLVQPAQELDQRRLPSAILAHDRDH